MADQKKEEKEIHPEELNINATAENIKLIGNKRERETTEEDKITQKACTCCKSSNSYFNESEDSKTIYDIFSKDTEFMNILKQNIDSAKLNENLELNCFCRKCLLNEFIKGGIEKIFTQKKLQENDKKEKKEKQELESTKKVLDKKIRELISIYSLNIMTTINKLKKLKDEYSISIKNTIEIFDASCIQILLSKNKESFPNLKTKIDDCKLAFDKINKNFENLIIEIQQKEEMKTFILEADNNANLKSKLLKILKNLEIEIDSNNMETPENSPDKNIKVQKISKEQTKKNISKY
jgi:adenylate kinase family enzyme